MKTKTVALFSLMLGTLLVTSTAHAGRASQGPPYGCGCVSQFIHGDEGRALSQSKAKQRARGKWETKARSAGGWSRRDWANAQRRHYDCRKKRSWHYCRAAGYPCHAVCEVPPSGN